jgi:hypothetical protein
MESTTPKVTLLIILGKDWIWSSAQASSALHAQIRLAPQLWSGGISLSRRKLYTFRHPSNAKFSVWSSVCASPFSRTLQGECAWKTRKARSFVSAPTYSSHRGAGPCRLRADHADYADFSNPARPPKIKLRGFDPERWGME